VCECENEYIYITDLNLNSDSDVMKSETGKYMYTENSISRYALEEKQKL